nr:ABC-ATPase domain-containing protein [Frisingicoccus sp.]
MKTAEELRVLLQRIDHRSYPAYKDIRGSYDFGDYILNVDHVQGDPFASPSKVSLCVTGKRSAFPARLYENRHRRIILQDYLLRQFGIQADQAAFKAKGSGKSGLISVSRCGQEILERGACSIHEERGDIRIRLEVGLPANGRTINGREAIRIFFELIPVCVEKSLYYKSLDGGVLDRNAELSDNQTCIRKYMKEHDLCAFVADGSILPRESGISQKPMKGAVKFMAPSSMKGEITVPHGKPLTGMFVKKGVTLIVGGGYHGKSTLLEALERGVYDHIWGDGREYVLTDETAFKIRAEDGRSIKNVDISMFINGLPNGKDTQHFHTEDASGSTSQAANVIEAMESGSQVLLIDEDTSATNFMIRDELMQLVVSREAEPITPYIDRIRELYEIYGISSIIVAGSSGSYFHKADHIIQMCRYIPEEITDHAKAVAKKYPLTGNPPAASSHPSFDRRPVSVDRKGNDRTKIKVMGRDGIQINRDTIDLRYVEQLVDAQQLVMLGYMLDYAGKHLMNGRVRMDEIVEKVLRMIEEKGMSSICENSYLSSGFAMPRKQEIFACFNRCRKLKM